MFWGGLLRSTPCFVCKVQTPDLIRLKKSIDMPGHMHMLTYTNKVLQNRLK